LPTPPAMMAFVAAPPPPPPPPPPPTPPAAAQAPKPQLDVNPAAAPVEAPAEIKPETGVESGVKGVVGGVEGGVVGGVSGGIVGGLSEAPPPPPPPAAPVRVGGNIKAPQKIKDVKPQYPAIAQSARVQGVVIIEATIGPNGQVQEAKVLRSIPLLDQAALDAVRQWVFTPTLLNGVPVPVIMTVTVNFTLQ
jgi:periplasmic protein TonB